MCIGAYRERQYYASCLRTHLQALTLFMLLFYGLLSFPSFKKGVFLRHDYFSPMRSISVVVE